MAQTSQQSQQQQHPHQCTPCNLVFDSLKSLEVHHTYNHSKNSAEFPFNRAANNYPGYVLGPGSDFPVLVPLPSGSPHSPQPNAPPTNYQNHPSHRYHPYSHSNSYPPESPRNNVSSSSPSGLINQPRSRGYMCDRCNFVTESQQRLLEHVAIAHSKSPTPNFQFGDCFPPRAAKPPGTPSEEILDLDSQKVHIYNPALHESGGGGGEENGINGRGNHSVNAMVSSWVNNSHPEKKYYMNHQNGSLPSPDFPSVSSTTISPPSSENVQQMQQPMNNFQHYGGGIGGGGGEPPNQQMPSQISSSQTAASAPANSSSVPNGKRSKGDASWKSNEARRPKTYNCSACNKWFTSSGHLKRHYNTTLHKNAVKQSNQPDPASMPISAHHHPPKDPPYSPGGMQPPSQCSPPPRAVSEDGPTGGSLLSVKSESESSPINNSSSRNVASPPSNYNNYSNFLSNSPNLMAGPSEHQSGGLLLSHPHLPQINSHLPPMSSPHPPLMTTHLPSINSHMPPINTTHIQYQHHPPQYHPTSNIHLIQSTSPAPPTMSTPQFMPLATSQGIPHSQCPGSPGAMSMNYPNLQPPHVSSTQPVIINNNFGNPNPEGLNEYTELQQQPNATYFAVNGVLHNFNDYQQVQFNNVEPVYYTSQSISNNCNEDVGGQVSPLSADIKAQSPHNESYSMERFTKIGNSPTSNGITTTDSRSDSGLETSPSPIDPIAVKYEYNYEDKKPIFKIENDADSFQAQDEYIMKENQTTFVAIPAPADSSVKKKKGLTVKNKNSLNKEYDDKNQVVTSTYDSFSANESPSPKVDKPIHRCDECDKIFNRSCYLTQHNKSFHSGIEKPFKCNRCGKRFVAESLHIEHLSKHQGDKPFKCDMCPKQFNHKTDLRRHMCLHSGEKPFSCDFCGKGFIRKDHMIKHTDTHKRKLNTPAVFNKIPAPKIVS